MAGYHYPEDSKLGSGLYRGYFNDSTIYTYDKDTGTVLLVGPVRTVAASSLDLPLELEAVPTKNNHKKLNRFYGPSTSISTERNTKKENRYHNVAHQDLSGFTSAYLKPGQPGEILKVSLCSNESFCCDLSYQYTGNKIYQFVVFSGRANMIGGINDLGVQQCGVLWCKTLDHMTCAYVELGLPESDFFGPFEISSSSFQSDVVFPIGNARDLSLIPNKDLEFGRDGNTYFLRAPKPIRNHLSAAIFGRMYSRDIFH